MNEWNGLFSTKDEQSWDGGFCIHVVITNGGNRGATDFDVLTIGVNDS